MLLSIEKRETEKKGISSFPPFHRNTVCSPVEATNDDYFWNQCTYDFSDLTIQQAIEFYIPTQNFKILKRAAIKSWNFFAPSLHFFE